MSTTETISFAVELAGPDSPNQAEVAAAASFARYSGRTLEAYRYDLRSFLQWAADVGLDGEVVNFRCHGAMMWPRYVASIVQPDLAVSLHREWPNTATRL